MAAKKKESANKPESQETKRLTKAELEKQRREEVKRMQAEDRERIKAVEETLDAGRKKVIEVQERNLVRKYPAVRRIVAERDALREEVAKLKAKK